MECKFYCVVQYVDDNLQSFANIWYYKKTFFRNTPQNMTHIVISQLLHISFYEKLLLTHIIVLCSTFFIWGIIVREQAFKYLISSKFICLAQRHETIYSRHYTIQLHEHAMYEKYGEVYHLDERHENHHVNYPLQMCDTSKQCTLCQSKPHISLTIRQYEDGYSC